jgi:hypothetical protein
VNPSSTDLARGHVGADEIIVQLIEPVGKPARIKITWPARPSLIYPKYFPEVASTLTSLFARAHIVLAGIKAAEGGTSDFSSFTDD